MGKNQNFYRKYSLKSYVMKYLSYKIVFKFLIISQYSPIIYQSNCILIINNSLSYFKAKNHILFFPILSNKMLLNKYSF